MFKIYVHCMENRPAPLKSMFQDYARDIEYDEKNEVIYFTLHIDEGAEEWMNTQGSAVCYSEIDGEHMIVEFDIRLSRVSVETVESAVDDLSMRYKVHIDTVDCGHGPDSIAHIRNYNCRIRIGDFEDFLEALHERISKILGKRYS